jgi:hypothetical protein
LLLTIVRITTNGRKDMGMNVGNWGLTRIVEDRAYY